MKKKVFLLWVIALSMNNLFTQGIWKTYTVEDGLAHNHVWCINQDNEGNMWFGTKKGMSKLDTSGIWTSYFTDCEIDWVMDIEFDSLNQKWIVAGINNDNPGNYVLALSDSQLLRGNIDGLSLMVYWASCIGKDSTGMIWVGSLENYAFFLKEQQWYPFYVWGTRIYDRVTDIKLDRNQKLYFAHDAGVSTLEGYLWPGVDTWIEIRRFAFDRQNRMWCASVSNGLRMLNLETYEWTIYTPPTLLADGCKCVAIDSMNAIWIGFYNGAQRFDGHSWQTFTRENGLVHNRVWDILVDKHGDIWFGTDEGVSVFQDTTTTHILNEKQIPFPQTSVLMQNYPNPFNATTQIGFQLVESAFVRIKIYNVLGQEIATLVNENRSGGFNQVEWHGKDLWGADVPSGIYVCQINLQNDATRQVRIMNRKMLLLR